jgi:hypothetical protein
MFEAHPVFPPYVFELGRGQHFRRRARGHACLAEEPFAPGRRDDPKQVTCILRLAELIAQFPAESHFALGYYFSGFLFFQSAR